jgi:hypothetical protein
MYYGGYYPYYYPAAYYPAAYNPYAFYPPYNPYFGWRAPVYWP